MKIKPIHPPYLYSIQFDGQEINEYYRVFDLWTDISYLEAFFKNQSGLISGAFWNLTPEFAIKRVTDEAYELDDELSMLFENTTCGSQPDFEDHFKLYGGKYYGVTEWYPMKSYGPHNPSLLRLYAIRFEKNCYLIVAGGIKLTKELKDTPGLQQEIEDRIDLGLRPKESLTLRI